MVELPRAATFVMGHSQWGQRVAQWAEPVCLRLEGHWFEPSIGQGP